MCEIVIRSQLNLSIIVIRSQVNTLFDKFSRGLDKLIYIAVCLLKHFVCHALRLFTIKPVGNQIQWNRQQ